MPHGFRCIQGRVLRQGCSPLCRFRDECLNQHWFTSIGEAREIIEDWRIDYNTERPHSSLKYQTPEEFAEARPFNKTQWAQPLELSKGSAPIAHAAE